MKSSNPILARTLTPKSSSLITGELMSIGGTINKTGLLLTIALACAAWPWNMVQNGNIKALPPIMIASVVIGFILSFVIVFRPQLAFIGAPLYAVCQGLALGAISSLLELKFPALALQAMIATFGTLGIMLLAYRTKVVRASENFKLGVIAATGGIALIYLISMIASLFGVTLPVIHENGTFGIIFSVVIVVIAALNLVLDFDLIEQTTRAGAPKYMEWYGAFALMVTLVWLYLEILKLLAKIRSKD